MFTFLKKIFGMQKGFPLGALVSPKDPRNIELAQFQAPVQLPNFHETEMPPVEDQGQNPFCVGEANHKIVELYFKRKGIIVDLSGEDLYRQCKLVDGIPDIEGTYPSVGASVACRNGIASVEVFKTGDKKAIEADRAKYKAGGYAFVARDYQAICQAIYQNGAITASFAVDNNWYKGIITRVLKSIGRHNVVLTGFYIPEKKLFGQNSWGIKWIGYAAGIIDKAIKPGHFTMFWADVHDSISDIIAFADVPQALIDIAKGTFYDFTRVLRFGSKGLDVVQLQKYLGMKVTDGVFGVMTEGKVIEFQKRNNLTPDGIFGPLSRKYLKDEVLKKKTV